MSGYSLLITPHSSLREDAIYRALGLLAGETIFWFWIGAHDEYECILGSE